MNLQTIAFRNLLQYLAVVLKDHGFFRKVVLLLRIYDSATKQLTSCCSESRISLKAKSSFVDCVMSCTGRSLGNVSLYLLLLLIA